MIRRTADPAEVERLAGVDLTDFLAEPMHVCLVDDGSVAFFAWRGPGIFELHVWFAVKGRKALDLLAAMLDLMQREHDAHLFWAMIPLENRPTRLFARLMGWKSLGDREDRFGPKELFVSETCQCRLSQ